ncbi:MAG: VanZ family protein [Candidatus Acidiferrales bacterium]
MTTPTPAHARTSPADSPWSTRILLLGLVGILFLTLYPFRFEPSHHLHANRTPFLLGGWGKDSGPFNLFLNVLLFVPFSFGLAGKFRERGKTGLAALGLTLATGALLSYSIEFLQIYIPSRDSGWEDVLTNSSGSVVGYLLFALCGAAVLRLLSVCETALESFLTLGRAALILALYFGLWIAISVPLQKETRLSNWDPAPLLVVGNTASGQPASAWKGEISRLEIWDRALPAALAESLTFEGPADVAAPSPLAAYDFSGSPPFEDQRHFLPDLSWTPKAPGSTGSMSAVLDGTSWLVSRAPVSALVDDIQKTGQFSIRVSCAPDTADEVGAQIVSISHAAGPVNLEFRQERASLVFWFRNPLTVNRGAMAWPTPSVFAPHQPRDFLLSFDGSDLSLYINGKEQRRIYRLDPGTRLAELFRRSKTVELEGYQYIFYSLVFFPAGCLVGLTGRKYIGQPMHRSLLIFFGVLLPALLLEIVLVRVSGRPISLEYVALSVLPALGGSLWINAGRRAHLVHETR